MTDRITVLDLDKGKLLSDPEIKKLDTDGFFSIDFFGMESIRACLDSYEKDPWEYCRRFRENLCNTRLQMTISGISLLGSRCFSDDVVEFFIEKAVENGIEIIRVYDALNDPRNLTTAINAAKRLGAFLQVGMIYAESKVHSVAFFAGYAAQLASMGADSICVCDPECLLTAQKVSELVTAIKGVVDIPLAISSVSEDVAKSASDAGAEIIVICENNSLVYTSELADEISLIRSEVGLVPLASPVSEIIKSQAELNLLAIKRYESVTNEFKALVKGCYGRTSVPIEQSFISSICGNEPLVLVRPADMIPPELNDIREKCAPWYEQEEDIITLAICGDEAIGFFELRKARKYSLDIPHANSKLGIHVI